jgi:hypothetical protein
MSNEKTVKRIFWQNLGIYWLNDFKIEKMFKSNHKKSDHFSNFFVLCSFLSFLKFVYDTDSEEKFPLRK